MTDQVQTVEAPAPPQKPWRWKSKWERKQLAAHASAPEHPAVKSTKEALLESAARIRAVAVKLPTPGVLDSSLHHDLLQKEVAVIEKIANAL